jgi:hypothetical protein
MVKIFYFFDCPSIHDNIFCLFQDKFLLYVTLSLCRAHKQVSQFAVKRGSLHFSALTLHKVDSWLFRDKRENSRHLYA